MYGWSVKGVLCSDPGGLIVGGLVSQVGIR